MKTFSQFLDEAPKIIKGRTEYHGTTASRAKSIQKDGFRGSEGILGKGVYSTPSKKEAKFHAKRHSTENDTPKVLQMKSFASNKNTHYIHARNMYDRLPSSDPLRKDISSRVRDRAQAHLKKGKEVVVTNVTDKKGNAVSKEIIKSPEKATKQIIKNPPPVIKKSKKVKTIRKSIPEFPIEEQKTFSQFIAEAEKQLKMLRVYHGTSKANAEKIKSDGFNDSEHGAYGSGIYSSTSRNVARRYSRDSGAASGKHAVDSGVVSSLIPSKKVKTIRQSNPESQEGRNKSKELRKSGQPAVRIKNAATGHETAKPDKGYEDEADYVISDTKVANKGIEKNPRVFRPTKDQKVTNRYGSPGREDGGYYTDRMKPRIEKPYVDRRTGTKKTQPKRK